MPRLPVLAHILMIPGFGVALSGCIEHRAELIAPNTSPQGGDGAMAIGPAAPVSVPPAPANAARTSALPIERTIDGWWRDEAGVLHRCAVTARTPLPWWQRFPIDAATDLWPAPVVSADQVELAFTAVPRRTRADLDREALASGYGGPRPAASSSSTDSPGTPP